MDKRPTLDKVYIDIVKLFAQRSSCKRRQVGSLITMNGKLISAGYNGSPRNTKNCLELGVCMREGVKSGEKLNQCRAVHAEMNSICNAAYNGISTNGSTIYCSTQPCSSCSKAIISAGIVKVIYIEKYDDEFSLKLLEEAGIEVIQYKEEQNGK